MVEIRRDPSADFASYEAVPISFRVVSRLDLAELQLDRFAEIPVEPYLKDYDLWGDERPSNLSQRFDTSGWVVLVARQNGRRVGGAILAPSLEYLGKRHGAPDQAVVVDLRVAPEYRAQGVGRALWQAIEHAAREGGFQTLSVETQDTNVSACRFYRAVGCELASVTPRAYEPLSDEARLIWRRVLPT